MRRSNQSILKKINPKYSLEGLMLKLKLQYFGYLMGRANSLEKTLMLGKIEEKGRRWQQRMRWLDGLTDLMDMNLNSRRQLRTGEPGVLLFMESQRVRLNIATKQQQQNWIRAPRLWLHLTLITSWEAHLQIQPWWWGLGIQSMNFGVGGTQFNP